MKIRTIAVVLNDNDFGSTFRPLLESIYNVIIYNNDITKDQIERCIKGGIEFHYLSYQRGGDIFATGYGTIENTVKYLLAHTTVLFDDEAEADIANVDRDGGAWYLELNTGKVYSY